MPDTLPVHVSRNELHGLEVPTEFETTGSFDIEIANHGNPLHVHLHLDDDLSRVATLEATNHYVEGESSRIVTVEIPQPRELRGKLKVVTAYGATTRYIDIIVDEPAEQKREVQVDESLNKPKPKAERSGPTPNGGPARAAESGGILADRPELAVLALGGFALLVAAFAAVVLQNTVVVLGSLVVLAGVLAAVYMLVQ